MKCEFCKISEAELEGYFYAAEKNFVNRATGTSGLLQLRCVCKHCVNEAIQSGRAKCKELIE